MARLFDDAASQHLRVSAVPITGYPYTMAAWMVQDDNAANCAAIGLSDTATAGNWSSVGCYGTVANDPVHARVATTAGGPADN